jgi:hypothetical protein
MGDQDFQYLKQIYICIKELGFIVLNGTFTEYQEKPIHFKKKK